MLITPIRPGEHLAEELKAFDMSASELARKIDVATNRITQILNGTRGVSGDTALRLARFFGTSAQFWLNLQTLYDLPGSRVEREIHQGTSHSKTLRPCYPCLHRSDWTLISRSAKLSCRARNLNC